MPNRDTHVPVGVAAGGLMAYARVPKEASGYQTLIEVLGGLLGGLIGARLPDVIDPATCPNHRDIGHGLVNALAAGKAYMDKLPEWQADFRERASRYDQLADAEQDGVKRFFYAAQSNLYRAIAGLLAGLIAGYGSHLVLDFTTPRSLPLICRGF